LSLDISPISKKAKVAMAENDQRRPSLQGIDAKICESGLRRDVYLTGTSLKFLFYFSKVSDAPIVMCVSLVLLVSLGWHLFSVSLVAKSNAQ
jgi:hypothetical protein